MALIASALSESLPHYSWSRFRADVLAGITLGLISIPLAMALAIAVGVPPQHGLYTSMIAGIVIALTGGSRVNVSGPTAAFVVILLPITQQFGLSGLLLASIMAGVMLMAMGATGLGKLVQFMPYPVTTGFTAGIAVVIAVLQIKDMLGLHYAANDAHFLVTISQSFNHLSETHGPDLTIALSTLFILITWSRLKTAIPPYLAALFIVTLASLMVTTLEPTLTFDTIGTRFTYVQDGQTLHGIPRALPTLVWPWDLPAIEFNVVTLKALSGPAFAIALLGAMESLLCAVVSDGLSGFKHHSNGELFGQGLGNVIAPLFGGITATAALARSAANVRAGATSPLAAVIHSLTIFIAVLLLAPYLAFIPMAALAALLVMVAWNMSDAREFVQVIKTSPAADVLVLLTCFLLTVIFDMVIAIEIGVVLAALLFIKRMSELSEANLSTTNYCHLHGDIPPHIVIYDISGPLFFGAAEKAMQALWRVDHGIKHVILNVADVPMIDLSGIVALRTMISELKRKNIAVSLCGVNDRIRQKLIKAHIYSLDNITAYDRIDVAIKASENR